VGILNTSEPRSLEGLVGQVDLAAFDCGEPSLNAWLARRAADAESITARTYLVIADARCLGYYCLSAAAVERAAWPGRVRRNAPDPVPCVRLGRLAVDRSAQGIGLGKDLLQHAIRRFMAASTIVGARALIAHALHEQAAAFYRPFGIAPLSAGSRTLFLPVDIITGAAAHAPSASNTSRHRGSSPLG
jgi:GNAT superfamily N-acetyltransferase